jgi:glutathione S-transferase
MLTDLGHPLQEHLANRGISMLTLYGVKKSRAVRCMWVMEELGLEYTHTPLNPHAGETRTSDYLALNPSGKIPTLVHDGFVLTETMAINLYLASNFGGTLLPKDAHNVAKVHQWSSWALTELEPALMAIVREGRRPKDKIDATRIEDARADIHKMIATVFEPQIAQRDYILQGEFTLADITVASVASSLQLFEISLDAHPATAAWMKRCFARPAWQRVQQQT